MRTMRAKVRVGSVLPLGNNLGVISSERLTFHAVCKSGGYPEDGTDEDNSFAKWTPSAVFDMQVNNPELWGKFKPGDTYYVDFTPAPSA